MTTFVGGRTLQGERPVLLPVGVAAAMSLVAWPISGHAVSAPLVAVGSLSMLAGLIDARTRRIPNHVVAAALTTFAAGAVITMIGDGRPPAQITGAALAGVIASGAPLLAVMWLLRPATLGAGDIKILTVQGATIGLLAPFAAPVVLLGGAAGGLVASIVLRRGRSLPLGPGLAVGFVAAVAAGVTANVLLGGVYG